MISGWDWVGYGPSRANQLWMFEKVSLSSEDIRDKLRVNSSLGKELEIRRPGRLYVDNLRPQIQHPTCSVADTSPFHQTRSVLYMRNVGLIQAG